MSKIFGQRITTEHGFEIDPKLRDLVIPPSADEREQLEENILADGCRDPLVVWDEENVLIDGHNRLKICDEHGLEFEVERISLPNEYAAHNWIINNQLGRRNLDSHQMAYLRGKRYESEKLESAGRPPGSTSAKNAEETSALENEDKDIARRTDERLAKELGVSDWTIRRDYKYAQAVDRIRSVLGEDATEKLIGKQERITIDDAIRLVKYLNEEQPEDEEKVITSVLLGPKTVGDLNQEARQRRAREEAEQLRRERERGELIEEKQEAPVEDQGSQTDDDASEPVVIPGTQRQKKRKRMPVSSSEPIEWSESDPLDLGPFLYRTDAVGLLEQLGSAYADLIIADPAPLRTDKIEGTKAWIKAALRCLKPGGRLYIFANANPVHNMVYTTALLQAAQSRDGTVGNPIALEIANDNLEPAKDYIPNWRMIHYWYGPEAPRFDMRRRTEQNALQRRKPQEMIEKIINYASAPGQIVIDPFTFDRAIVDAAVEWGRQAEGIMIEESDYE